jgi:hypothetical protein
MRTFSWQLAGVFATLFVLAESTLVGPVAAGSVPFGQRPDDWVEGTQVLDDGATRDFYNRAASLPWENLLGDWRDANDVAQGSLAFDAVAMLDDDTDQYIEWDVTGLVQAWVDGTFANQGFFVRLVSGGSTYDFRSREYGDIDQRPELALTTTSGSITYSPHADTWVATSTYQNFGDSEKLRVSPNENTLIRFDLSSIPAAAQVLSAKLRLFVFAEYGSSTVGIYRAEQGDTDLQTQPILGLASSFPGDQGITSDPAVYFAEDFEDPAWGSGWSYGTGSSTLTRLLSDPPRLFQPLLGHALRVEIPNGTNTGMSVGYRFDDKHGFEPEEIYFRYYIRVAESWQTLDGGKFPGIAGRYGTAGWGGRQSDGTNGWSARGLFKEMPPAGNPLEHTVPVGSYVYHADMPTQYGDNHLWQNDYLGYLEKNRWYCIEQYLLLNTPGVQNGIMRVWIDGRLAWEKYDWRWRTISSLKIEEIWMNVYHGGSATVDRDVHLYVDNVVIAQEYIGPVASDLFADGFETGNVSAWSDTAP